MTAGHAGNTLLCKWPVVRPYIGRSILQGGPSWVADPPCVVVSVVVLPARYLSCVVPSPSCSRWGSCSSAHWPSLPAPPPPRRSARRRGVATARTTRRGLGLICQTTIVNTFTGSGGSAVVTVRECHGAAGDADAACMIDDQNVYLAGHHRPSVQQLDQRRRRHAPLQRPGHQQLHRDRSGRTDATMNQCVGSGGGITTGCDPFPATYERARSPSAMARPTAEPSSARPARPPGRSPRPSRVKINQCNGSANGGGALVICSARIANNFGWPTTPTAAGGGGGGGTTPPTDVTYDYRNGIVKQRGTCRVVTIFLFAFVDHRPTLDSARVRTR